VALTSLLCADVPLRNYCLTHCFSSVVIFLSTLCSGRVPNGNVRAPTVRNVPWELTLIMTATVIYRLGHGFHTVTAVLKSTQPSCFHGTVKQKLSFGLSNNNKGRDAHKW